MKTELCNESGKLWKIEALTRWDSYYEAMYANLYIVKWID